MKGWLVFSTRKLLWRFILASLLGVAAVGCAAAMLSTSGYLISRSALQPENILMVYVPVVLVRAFGFGKAALQYVERLAGHNAALHAVSAMRSRLYRALEPQALLVRSRFRTGELLGLLADDIERLQHVYLRIVLPGVAGLLLYGTAVALLGRFDGVLALQIALYGALLLFAAPAAGLLATFRAQRQLRTERAAAYRETADAVFGLSDWLLSGRSAQWLGQERQRHRSLLGAEQRLQGGEWRRQWLLHASGGVATVWMVWWAAGMAAQGQLAPVWIAAFGLALLPLLEIWIRVAEAWEKWPGYEQSLRRLSEVEQDASGLARQDQVEAAPLPETQAIRFSGVGFRYSGSQQWSLRHISFELEPGRKLALLGRSGAGKTTLLRLLQGALQPGEGRVTIGGREAHTLERQGGRLFAVLSQSPYLFDTTVGNNIRLGRPEASDEDIRRAAQTAGIDALITSLPDGYNTRVEEAGRRFSGGERQRIALARILLQDCPIVLLDEPAAGLDPLTEQALMATLFAALRGKTVLWVTHHLRGVEQVDEVLFIGGGTVAMRGSHAELLQREGRYRELFALDCPDEAVLSCGRI